MGGIGTYYYKTKGQISKIIIIRRRQGLFPKVVDTVSAPVSVWPLEWDISVPVNIDVPFQVYRKYIYIYSSTLFFA
jgi:hypothetical protein